MRGVAAALTSFDPHPEAVGQQIVGWCPDCKEFGVRAVDACCPVCRDKKQRGAP